MDQRELLKLARASLKKKGRQRRKGAARALAREAPGPDTEDGRTDEVERALSRIAALDAKLEEISQVSEATESIQEAEARVLDMDPVENAEASVAAMDRHIAEEHEFATFDEPTAPRAPSASTPGRPRATPKGLREAFRLHLLLGPPKATYF